SLEQLAVQLASRLNDVPGITNVGVFRVQGQPNLELPIDAQKCNYWGVSVEDVNSVVHTAVGGKPFTQMIEGEKRFDVALRFPERLRNSEEAILNIPVDVYNNRVTEDAAKSHDGISTIGSSFSKPSTVGTTLASFLTGVPHGARRRLADLVTPLDEHGQP